MNQVEIREVAESEDGIRLDRWFKRHFPNLQHGRLEKLLRTGQIRLDGHRAKANSRLEAGQSIRIPPIAEDTSGPAKRIQPKVSDADIQALATYFVSIDGAAERSASLGPALQRAAAADRLNVGTQIAPAARLYTAACASCHYNGAGQPNPLRPDLALNSAVNLDDPTNLIRVVLSGGYLPATAANPRPYGMPPFSHVLGDGEIAAVITYIRSAWGNAAAPVTGVDVMHSRARGAQ